MAEIKLTKNQMKTEQQKLGQLERYLPTLQLKKSLLKAEVGYNKAYLETLKKEYLEIEQKLFASSRLMALEPSFPFEKCLAITHKEITTENIAGAELPILKTLLFQEMTINFFDTPPWLDSFLELMKAVKIKQCHLQIAKERLSILENELNDVSTRVNLFEKRLIPLCKENIKRIRIFLSDVQLAAVSQAKVAKAKILERKIKNALKMVF
jgi:V/A-type H+-transporting ATPase subunit D